ncbi:MAG: hypothetical protein KY450_06735 [Actinobacteria bacterium]|nr:hypothetical protein [Actinomycetota bacterium]
MIDDDLDDVDNDRRRSDAEAGAGVLAIGCAGFVMSAVVLEAVAGSAANSPVPSWAEGLFPISWPQPVRVAWWFAVAVAALGFRLALVRLGLGRNRLVTALTVLPFAVLAAGVALGADWATWH